MISQEITVKGEFGKRLDRFMELACSFKSSISFEIDQEKRINAKSSIGIQQLNLQDGDELVLLIHGADAQEAMINLRRVLEE